VKIEPQWVVTPGKQTNKLSLAMFLIALFTLRRKERWLWVMKRERVEGSGGKYFIINPSIFLKELSDT
jgi:hypothetical protein